jgi:hypothetical protein
MLSMICKVQSHAGSNLNELFLLYGTRARPSSLAVLGYKGKWGAVTQVLPRRIFFLHTKSKAKTVLINESVKIFPRKPQKDVILGPIIPPSCSGNSLLRCCRVGISALYGVRPI